MIRFARALLMLAGLTSVSMAQTAAQTAPSTPPAAKKADAYYNFAMGRLYAGIASESNNPRDIDKAIQYYKEALKADPSASPIYEDLTELYVAINKISDAQALAQDILKQNPESVDAHRMLGRVYTAAIAHAPQGQIDEKALHSAIQEYKTVTDKDPKDADSWVVLGKLYRTANDAQNAEKAYNQALGLEPDNEEALTGLAMVYGDMGDAARAIEKLKAATDKNPNPRFLMILAQAYKEQKDFRNAADATRKALAMAPDNDQLLAELADDLLMSDQLDEALKIYGQLAAKSPKDAAIPLRIAEIYRNKHNFAKAHEALDKAKQIEPDDLNIREEELRLLKDEGRTDDAIAALKKLLDDTDSKIRTKEQSQQRAGLYQELGDMYRDAAKYPEALEAFKQMGTVSKDTAPLVAIETVDTYRAAKDLPSAQREADAALKKFPNDYMVTREHAEVLGDMGKIDEAEKELRALLNGQHDYETLLAIAEADEKGKRFDAMGKALNDAEKLSNTDDEKIRIHFMRGAMLERQKKFNESETSFRKVLALNPEHAGALNYLGYMLADRNERWTWNPPRASIWIAWAGCISGRGS
jgi:tetratricopeptide (TPR) repeat protein